MVEIVITAALLMVPCIIAALLTKYMSNTKIPPVYEDKKDEWVYEK